MKLKRAGIASAPKIAAAGGLAVVGTLLSGSVADAAGTQVNVVVNSTLGTAAGVNAGTYNYSAHGQPESLADAMALVSNEGAGTGNTVTFASNVTGTINLTAPLPPAAYGVDIQGPGASVLTINGSGATAGPLFTFNAYQGATDEISGLTIENGTNTSGYGGAIDTEADLTVSGVTITGSSTGENGGAIAAWNGTSPASGSAPPTLTIENSTISDNYAYYLGGGVYSSGPLTVSGSTISGNVSEAGGGLYATGAVNVNGSTLSGNVALDLGGAATIFATDPGPQRSRTRPSAETSPR